MTELEIQAVIRRGIDLLGGKTIELPPYHQGYLCIEADLDWKCGGGTGATRAHLACAIANLEVRLQRHEVVDRGPGAQ